MTHDIISTMLIVSSNYEKNADKHSHARAADNRQETGC